MRISVTLFARCTGTNPSSSCGKLFLCRPLEWFSGGNPLILLVALTLFILLVSLLSKWMASLLVFGIAGWVVGCPLYLPSGVHSVIAVRFPKLSGLAVALGEAIFVYTCNHSFVLALICAALNVWKAQFVQSQILTSRTTNIDGDLAEGLVGRMFVASIIANSVACFLGIQNPSIYAFMVGTGVWLLGDIFGFCCWIPELHLVSASSPYARPSSRHLLITTSALGLYNEFVDVNTSDGEANALTKTCFRLTRGIVDEMIKYDLGPATYELTLAIVKARARRRLRWILFYGKIKHRFI